MTEGFSVWKEVVDQVELFDLAYNKHTYDYPNRGHDRNGVYYEKYYDGVEWANYWTGPLNDNRHVRAIRESIDRIVGKFLVQPVFYHADVSVMTSLNSLVRPHVDTPHRHVPWSDRVHTPLGIQVAIPMHDVSTHAGTTAFLPKSFKKSWPIKDCYKGKFTDEFLKDAVQPEMDFGDALIWDARTLHSQMPNITEHSRYMLLLNYLEENIVDSVMQYEKDL